MKRRGVVGGVAIALALMSLGGAATAAPPRRVIVAGPDDDTIATRIQKEITALGFEAVRVGSLDGCARSAVVVAAQDSAAAAATCSDGDQVGIWIADGGTLRLRDVVVVREEGDAGRETTAVRAAEVTRVIVAMHEAEAEARANAPPAPAPVTSPAPAESDEGAEPKPPPPATRRAPTFLASAGLSGLLGIDASVAAFSGQLEVGILRYLTAAARVEIPLTSSELGGTSGLNVAPGFAGGGIVVPLTSPDAFIIPRLGAGIGAAWIKATRRTPLTSGPFDPQSFATSSSDSTASFAGYANVGFSMRVYGPLRLVVDSIFGMTTSRLVVRDQGTHAAYWGVPFGGVALRVELLFK
ncbi:MAG: hypothetical protein K0S65_345 [Labilithrix sp.]|nr:hypothetical protein [Labilithrix sp.]